MTEAMRLMGLLAVGLFVAFTLGNLLLRLPPRDPKKREAYGRFREAMKRSREASSADVRAEALCEASMIALEGLDRPGLAASLARRAERVRPTTEGVRRLVRALEAAKRYAALERLLWRELTTAEGERYEALFDALLSLYEGAMRTPERAHVLRKLALDKALRGAS